MNTTNDVCDQEFTQLTSDDCTIDANAYHVMKIVTLSAAFISLVINGIVGFQKHQIIRKKKKLSTKLLLGCIPIISVIIIIRTVLNLALHANSRNALWMHILVSMIAMIAINAAILSIYIELDTARSGVVGKQHKDQKDQKRELGIFVFSGCVSVIFATGPFLTHYAGIPGRFTFWITVAIGNLIMPYFCYVNYTLYRVIKDLHRAEYDSVACHILCSSVICGTLGILTGSIAIISSIYAKLEWIAFDGCLIFAIIFYTMIFGLFSRKPTVPRKAPSSLSVDFRESEMAHS